MNVAAPSIIQFDLPVQLACPKPTEERNMKRDEVRLLVTTGSGQIHHTTFNQLTSFLQKGDVLVVNTSATIAGALPVTLPGGGQGRLHLSTTLKAREWLVEIREITANKTIRWKGGEKGMVFRLPAGANVTLNERFYKDEQLLHLWIAEF